MSHALLCFASTYVAVFALGLQTSTRDLAAAFTSLLIGGSSIALYKVMPEANGLEIVSYLAGGVLGIVSSMWFHREAKARLREAKARLAAWRARRRLRAALRRVQQQRAKDLPGHRFADQFAPGTPPPIALQVCDRARSGYPPCIVWCGDCVEAPRPGDTH